MNEAVAICVIEIGNGVVMALLRDHRIVLLNAIGEAVEFTSNPVITLERLRDSATHMLLHLEQPSNTNLH